MRVGVGFTTTAAQAQWFILFQAAVGSLAGTTI